MSIRIDALIAIAHRREWSITTGEWKDITRQRLAECHKGGYRLTDAGREVVARVERLLADPVAMAAIGKLRDLGYKPDDIDHLFARFPWRAVEREKAKAADPTDPITRARTLGLDAGRRSDMGCIAFDTDGESAAYREAWTEGRAEAKGARQMTITEQAETERMRKAHEKFDGHEIVKRSADGVFGRWTLRCAKSSNDWCEIVEADGYLFITGDIDALVIGVRCGDGHKSPGDLVIRAGRDVREGGAHRKVMSGMSVARDFVYDLDDDVARQELVAWLRSEEVEEPEGGFDTMIEDIVNELRDDDKSDDFDQVVYDACGRCNISFDDMPHDDMSRWGWVTTWRVAKGLAAVRRLAALLGVERSSEIATEPDTLAETARALGLRPESLERIQCPASHDESPNACSSCGDSGVVIQMTAEARDTKLALDSIRRPVTYDPECQRIADAENETLLDVRGWGRFGHLKNGAERQDALGRMLVRLINGVEV